MSTVDIVILIIIVSYVIYRTTTPKKGDTTSTPGGRFFGAIFKSFLALIIAALVIALFQLVFIGSSIGGVIGIFSLLGR